MMELVNRPTIVFDLDLVEPAKVTLCTFGDQMQHMHRPADIRSTQVKVEEIGKVFSQITEVRYLAQKVFLLGEHRMGELLLEQPTARGTRSIIQPGMDGAGVAPISTPAGPATLTELVGDKFYGSRLRSFGKKDIAEIEAAIDQIHADNQDAFLATTLRYLRNVVSLERRAESRAALPLVDNMDYRIGDCRVVLDDIAPNSIPLILTDPPYGNDAKALYEWLAVFAERTLIPGGSLICYTGQAQLNRDMAILSERLRYWWLCIMPHTTTQRFPGRFVTATFKPVLWYVKEHRRVLPSLATRGKTQPSMMSDEFRSAAPDKIAHDWAQGEGGVWVPIETLTDPGEKIVDPFAGTGTWGRIAAEMGRLWIGADVEQGGSKRVVA
jgi:hypothetical protein